MKTDRFRQAIFTLVIVAASLTSGRLGLAQQATTPTAGSAAAADIADFFSQVGDQIYEDCIFELSQEQIEVQQALIKAYIEQGATSVVARQLAVKQIQPPQAVREMRADHAPQPSRRAWPPRARRCPCEKKPAVSKSGGAQGHARPLRCPTRRRCADKKILPQWDCAPNVDFVTISSTAYERKLTGGEICNPFEDVVREVPASLRSFRLGYTIRTGRLFVISDDPQVNGKTIAWAISGRDVCRNNPDPDCFAARAVGPLPPGEYSFAADKDERVSWGPKTKRNVAGI